MEQIRINIPFQIEEFDIYSVDREVLKMLIYLLNLGVNGFWSSILGRLHYKQVMYYEIVF